MSELGERVSALAEARRQLALEQDAMEMVTAEVERVYGVRMKNAIEGVAEAKAKVAALDDAVRELAYELYVADGDKHPHPAVNIKVYTVLDYGEDDAKEYALRHMNEALKLDKRVFEKNTKALMEMDLGEVTDELKEIVTVQDDPRVTIARDLGGY